MTTCGLCPHPIHPANQCEAVYHELRPWSKAQVNPVRCPCWREGEEGE